MAVARVTEISSTSTKSFEDAIQSGVARATKTLRNVRSAWIKEQRVDIRDGNIAEYQVNMMVTFILDDSIACARPRRIAVIGRAGSGKSTAAVALGRAFDLPVVHLDQLTGRATGSRRPPIVSRPPSRPRMPPNPGSSRRLLDTTGVRRSGAPCGPRRNHRGAAGGLSLPGDPRHHSPPGRPRADRPNGADERIDLAFLIWSSAGAGIVPTSDGRCCVDPTARIEVVRRVGDLGRLLAG